jgi:L-asparaginase/Glu-tRNA(Gln) amidotransferase subunit D
LAELAKGGALVIRSTRVTDGVVTPQDEDKANNFICTGALTTNKARILAMVALAAARKEGTEMNYERLAEIFDQFQPKN